MNVILIVGIIACIAIVSDKSLIESYKWLIIAPLITFVLMLFSIVGLFTESVPEGKNITKPIAVASTDSKEVLYWNLYVDVFEDYEDRTNANGSGSVVSYDAYYIVGYVSPETGKLIEVETRDPVKLGDRCRFYEKNKWGDSAEYSAVVKRSDVDVTVYERITAVGPLEVLLELAAAIVAIYAGIVALKKISKV